MRSPEALSAALSLRENPHLVWAARSCPLPKGMTLLLEAAAGETGALGAAAAKTGRSENTIRKAAGFFIEQVLLSPEADSYRILGAVDTAPHSELRRHLALLMRWLHPDLVSSGQSGDELNRGIYASRVAGAWANIKTAQRRSSYDKSRASEPEPATLSSRPLKHPKLQRRLRKPDLTSRSESGYLWSRLRLLLASKR